MLKQNFIKPFSLVVAAGSNGAIGNMGNLPWPYIPKEMKHFVEITTYKEKIWGES